MAATNPYRGACPERSRRGGAWGYTTDPSSLLQLGARFYWPELGRFIQQDPIGDDINWYAYAGNNPVVYADPNGECLETVFDIAMVAWSAYDFVKDPSWTTGGALAADVVGAAIPFVPSAGGMAVRAGKAADKAADAGRAARRARGASEVPRNWRDPKKAQELTRAAEKRYPKLAVKARGTLYGHHPLPKYAGGDPIQTLSRVSPAYSQVIHNEWYKYVPAGSGALSRADLYRTADKVYKACPLP